MTFFTVYELIFIINVFFSFNLLQYELAIHTVVKIDPKNVIGGQNLNGLLASLKDGERVYPEIIFKFEDVVALSVLNVDLNFASKGRTTYILSRLYKLPRFFSIQVNSLIQRLADLIVHL